MSSTIAVGQVAPNFTLPRSPKDKVTLSEVLRDKNVVLAFFVLAFTSP